MIVGVHTSSVPPTPRWGGGIDGNAHILGSRLAEILDDEINRSPLSGTLVHEDNYVRLCLFLPQTPCLAKLRIREQASNDHRTKRYEHACPRRYCGPCGIGDVEQRGEHSVFRDRQSIGRVLAVARKHVRAERL